MESNRRRNSTATHSLYEELHDEVSILLETAGLHLEFQSRDDDTHCTETYDTNIMGRFICHNRACRSKGWSSNMIPITIRLYPEGKYNARVYHQRCKACKRLSRPRLDHSYAERVVYRIKKWHGFEVEIPPFSHDSRGPHNRALCEGCVAGHCLRSEEDLATAIDRSVAENFRKKSRVTNSFSA